MWILRQSQPVVNVVQGAEKKQKGFARAVLNPMGIVKSGHSHRGVRFINVRRNTMYSFADCVKSFRVRDLLRKSYGDQM